MPIDEDYMRQLRSVACPVCGVKSGEPCVILGETRSFEEQMNAVHTDRARLVNMSPLASAVPKKEST